LYRGLHRELRRGYSRGLCGNDSHVSSNRQVDQRRLLTALIYLSVRAFPPAMTTQYRTGEMGNGYRDIIVAWLRVYHSRANLGTAQDCSEQNERYEQTMDFSGTETFSAPIEEVWTYLADA